MQQQFDNEIALFVRDERTVRYAFNAQALKALAAEARDPGYSLKDETGSARPFDGISGAALRRI
jgi:hypothetical protein